MNGKAGFTSFLIVAASTIGLLVPLERGRRLPPQPTVVAFSAEDSSPSRTERVLGSDLVCQYVHAGRDLSGEPAGRCDRHSVAPRVVIARVIVAVLPDPLDSHLDWGFDAALESIQRAFEHSNFVPDRYWFPWRPVADSGHGDSKADASLRASSPGVMLFRNSSVGADSLALVYLVGETPTRGIQARAFRVALADLHTLATRAHSGWRLAPGALDTLRIVGPIFSGSARSLRNALRDAYGKRGREVVVVSGGATASSNRRTLSGCIPAAALIGSSCRGAHLHFSATVQPVDTLRAIMERVLCDEFRIPRSRIAYLKESNTQYAAGPLSTPSPDGGVSECGNAPTTAGGGRPLEIPFPINISRLRREYARLTSSTDTATRGLSASRTHIDWRDPASAAESPPPLSELTAPIIERTLTDIEQTLVLHRVRAVGIIATDVRDRLFLAGAVKERFRDVKVFFVGSHALYLRPELNDQLRGAVVVSTYPLFLENQFWDVTHGNDRERLVFTSDQSEGTYNAALIQLGHSAATTDYSYPLTGSFAPTQASRRPAARDTLCGPPVWLTVVGSGSMMPLAAESPETASPAGAASDSSYVYRRPCSMTAGIGEDVDAISDESLFVWLLALAFTGLLVIAGRRALHVVQSLAEGAARFLLRRRPHAAVDDGAADQRLAGNQFAWESREIELRMHQHSWLLFAFVAAACGAATLALILFRPQVHGFAPSTPRFLVFIPSTKQLWPVGPHSAAHLGMASIVGIIVFTGFWLVLEVIHDLLSRKREGISVRASDRPSIWQHLGLVVVGMLYLAFTTAWLSQIVFFPRTQGAMYMLRTLQLNSGVSPAVPVLVGALTLGLWGMVHGWRAKALLVTSAFEAACASGQIDAAFVQPRQHPTPPGGAVIARDDEYALRSKSLQLGTTFNLRRWVTAVRSGLFDLFPRFTNDRLASRDARVRSPIRPGALAFCALIVLFWLWLMFTQIDRTNEVAALGSLFGMRYLPSSFDLLFRFLIVCSVTLSAWTLYRLYTTWDSLRNCLRNIDVMPLGRGFERLPKSIATLARFSPFASSNATALQHELDRAAYQRWYWLRKHARDAVDLVGETPVLRTNPSLPSIDIVQPLQLFYSALRSRVLHEPALLSVSEEALSPSVARASERATIAALQELVALYVVDYVTWGLRHVRDLASFLLASLVFTTGLLSSYPFEPSSFLKVAFFALMALSVVEIGAVLVQVNRNSMLSRIAHTTPGEITWDLRFVVNLLLVAGVPLLTVLAAQFPEVRELLFAWVTPIVKALGKV